MAQAPCRPARGLSRSYQHEPTETLLSLLWVRLLECSGPQAKPGRPQADRQGLEWDCENEASEHDLTLGNDVLNVLPLSSLMT